MGGWRCAVAGVACGIGASVGSMCGMVCPVLSQSPHAAFSIGKAFKF